MSEKRYWFVSYILSGQLLQSVMNEHPLKWLADWHKMRKDGPTQNHNLPCPMPTIVFFRETSKENYDKLKEYTG